MVSLGEKKYNTGKIDLQEMDNIAEQIKINEILHAIKTQIPYLSSAIDDMYKNRFPEAHGKIDGVISVLKSIIKEYS